MLYETEIDYISGCENIYQTCEEGYRSLMDVATADKLVNAFGAILENKTGPAGTQVADVNELPFAKDLIKLAFQTEYLNSQDAQYRELLSACYVQLADYQIGVGPRRIGPDMSRWAEKQRAAKTP